MSDQDDRTRRRLSGALWWLLPLIIAAIAVALVVAFGDSDGTNGAYPLY